MLIGKHKEGDELFELFKSHLPEGSDLRFVIVGKQETDKRLTVYDEIKITQSGRCYSGVHYFIQHIKLIFNSGEVYRYSYNMLTSQTKGEFLDSVPHLIDMALQNKLHTHKESRSNHGL